MARRRSSAAIVRTVSATPTIRLAVPRAAPMQRRQKTRRRSNGGAASGGMTITEAALTGAGIGILMKQDFVSSLPTIGPLGKVGSLGLALHFFGKGNAWARRGAKACAILAGYQYMKAGSVDGLDGDDL